MLFMKKSITLRTRLFAMMALLAVLQGLALVMALAVSNVFYLLDAEAFRLFNGTVSARVTAFDKDVGQLVGNLAEDTRNLGAVFNKIAAEHEVAPDMLYRDDLAYAELAMEGSEVLMQLLRANSITGAFFILNGSNSDKEAAGAHSAVYIRNSAPSKTSSDINAFWLEVGPAVVAQNNQISSGVSWRLDMQLPKGEAAAFYEKPIWAAEEYPGAEMERYGYWQPPSDLLGNKQMGISYTMPLLDAEGRPYGVLGIEISLPYFTQNYLPNIELPYENSFYMVAPAGEQSLQLDWYIPGGPLAQVYVRQGDALALSATPERGMYKTQISGLGDMYCAVKNLTIYSQNSPFVGDAWTLVGMVPQQVLHEGSAGVRLLLVISIAATTLVAFVAIFLLVYLSTRKITNLSRHIKGVSPYQDIHFEATGLREIDELTTAVEMLNQSAISSANTTSKILEMTLLPIGGYELSSSNKHVVLTEFVYELLNIPPGTLVPGEEWPALFGRLTASPAAGYENIYQYFDRGQKAERWLRVMETPTEEGCVGVILDVTRDIEENRRLAHELDFDTLTRLYNRKAFSREVQAKLQAQPDKVGAMLFADLDNLKYVNDTYGHDMGDRLIVRAGEMFHEFSIHGGVVARISGDEFAIYLHDFESKEEARDVIRDQYRHYEAFSLLTPDGGSQRIRCSSGVSWYPDDADNVTDLLKLADYAMYEAKHKEKGSLFEFSMESYHKNAFLLENREAINRLLDEKLIRFAFQPIVDLHSGEIYAYEALMRPLLDNFRSPLEILQVAAAQSKLSHLERLIIFSAFQMVEENQDKIHGAMVFINSIPSQVMCEEDLLLLQRMHSRVFDRVVIEITEAENDSPHQLTRKVNYIRDNHMQLAIDDFGSGYSNEVRILAIQPDIVKLDMELIQGIHKNKDKQTLVKNIISFCHAKRIRLIAEGVEDAEDLEEIIRLDVDYVQGYYTARPAFEFAPLPEEKKREILRLQGLREMN